MIGIKSCAVMVTFCMACQYSLPVSGQSSTSTLSPTSGPTTSEPSTSRPTRAPTTLAPTSRPTTSEPTTSRPTHAPTSHPTTASPTSRPTSNPTTPGPTHLPTTAEPTISPTLSPSMAPTVFRDASAVARLSISMWDLPEDEQLLGLPSTSSKWNGGIYSSSTGKIYGMPASAESILVIDPLTGATDLLNFTLASDGTAPHCTGVLDQDTETNTTDTQWDNVSFQTNTWNGGAYVSHRDESRIVGCPGATSALLSFALVINPSATADKTSTPYWISTTSSSGWQSPVVGSDPSIMYCMPGGSSRVLKIMFRGTPLGILFAEINVPQSMENNSWASSAYDESSGMIYALPGPSTLELLILDPNTDSVSLVRIHQSMFAEVNARRLSWAGAVVNGWSGNIIGVPAQGGVLSLDPSTMATNLTLSSTVGIAVADSKLWDGGVFNPDTGRIICIPATASGILILETPDIDAPTTTSESTTFTTSATSTVLPPTEFPTPSPSTANPTVAPTYLPAAQAAEGENDDNILLVVAVVGALIVIAFLMMLVFACKKRSARNAGKFTPYITGESISNPIFQQSDSMGTFEASTVVSTAATRFANPEVETPKSYVPLNTIMYVSREDAAKLMKGFSSGAFVVRPSSRSSSGKAITLLFDQYGQVVTGQFAVSEDSSGVYVGGNMQPERFSSLETLLTLACVQLIPPFPCTLCPLPDDVILKYATKPTDSELIKVGGETDVPEVVLADSAEVGPSRSAWGDDVAPISDPAGQSGTNSNAQESGDTGSSNGGTAEAVQESTTSGPQTTETSEGLSEGDTQIGYLEVGEENSSGLDRDDSFRGFES